MLRTPTFVLTILCGVFSLAYISKADFYITDCQTDAYVSCGGTDEQTNVQPGANAYAGHLFKTTGDNSFSSIEFRISGTGTAENVDYGIAVLAYPSGFIIASSSGSVAVTGSLGVNRYTPSIDFGEVDIASGSYFVGITAKGRISSVHPYVWGDPASTSCSAPGGECIETYQVAGNSFSSSAPNRQIYFYINKAQNYVKITTPQNNSVVAPPDHFQVDFKSSNPFAQNFTDKTIIVDWGTNSASFDNQKIVNFTDSRASDSWRVPITSPFLNLKYYAQARFYIHNLIQNTSSVIAFTASASLSNLASSSPIDNIFVQNPDGTYIRPGDLIASHSYTALSGAKEFCDSQFPIASNSFFNLNIANGLCQVGGFLFIPSTTEVQAWQNLPAIIAQSAPISWAIGFYQVNNDIFTDANIASTSDVASLSFQNLNFGVGATHSIHIFDADMPATLIGSSSVNLMRNLMSAGLWFTFGLAVYFSIAKRLKT